jgi:glycosyltransferase involved in cell wall biosynthesis
MTTGRKRVLWWGRFDPDYSRNRILRQAYGTLGWEVFDFHPLLSSTADIEARMRRLPTPDLVHVPCFRQRDIAAANRYARRHGLRLLIDPLISAYDKQIFEREKFPEHSRQANRLLGDERKLFQCADVVLADTSEHARFFVDTLGVTPENVHIVHVGGEEALFTPAPRPHPPNNPLEVLFYGSFIPLQGPQVIIDAARLYQGPPVSWVLLGNGPLLDDCKRKAAGLPNVTFENWLPYADLPDRIRRADILLGVFGATPKAQRVIPNKVFQALACGKPVVTCSAPAYPAQISGTAAGITFVAAGRPNELADAISRLAVNPEGLQHHGCASRALYEQHFSFAHIAQQLAGALSNNRSAPHA